MVGNPNLSVGLEIADGALLLGTHHSNTSTMT
jgi:hypothetical protein